MMIYNVYRSIIKPSHDDYIRTMLATANPSNLKDIYKGFQSSPLPGEEGGLEIRMWKHQGSLETPGFRGNYSEGYYKENKIQKMILEFPEGMDRIVGSGSLIIQVDVDTREKGMAGRGQGKSWDGKIQIQL